MKAVLFCKRPYSFGILHPLNVELQNAGGEVLWYVAPEIVKAFPFKDRVDYTTSLQDVYDFKSDAIFVPGNIVPHYLRGVKVQVFHGLAGEKKGHFRIRNYFDLYLTQGPYFTERFKELASKHKDFDVIETGWCKLDSLYRQKNDYGEDKTNLLEKYKAKKIILYAPTFSPSLTSAEIIFNKITSLAQDPDYLVLVKFHDLMNREVKEKYVESSSTIPNLVVVDDPDIIKYLIFADLMISDTSSVVYEFLLLNKPVITFNSSSRNIKWLNLISSSELPSAVESTLDHDEFAEGREWIIANYHPYRNGESAERMVDAVKKWLQENPVPQERKLSFLRRWKVYRKYGKVTRK